MRSKWNQLINFTSRSKVYKVNKKIDRLDLEMSMKRSSKQEDLVDWVKIRKQQSQIEAEELQKEQEQEQEESDTKS